MSKNNITCGKCKSVFFPRRQDDGELDFSCPMCKFGKLDEKKSSFKDTKVLLD